MNDTGAVEEPGGASRASAPSLTVYYDGGCPVCRREIDLYRRARGAERLDWVDASSCGTAALGDDLTPRLAMARLHVRDEGGRLIEGAAAFAAIWRRLPGTRPLGRVAGSRLALALLEPAYTLFLKLRPLWRRRAESPPGRR